MKESGMLLFPIFPDYPGDFAAVYEENYKEKNNGAYYGRGPACNGACCYLRACAGVRQPFTLFQLTTLLPIYFKADAVGRLFVSVVTIVGAGRDPWIPVYGA